MSPFYKPMDRHELLSALDRPVGMARGLPGRVYFSEDVFEDERKRLFAPSWLPIGYASEIENPGDALPVSIAGWELVLVRSQTGEIVCFHNVCRHRGMKLVKQKSNLRRIVCSYHCWGYDLSGKLDSTPNIGGVGIAEADGVNKAELSLLPVRIGMWNHMIFANPDGKAEPLETFMEPVSRRLEQYEFPTATKGIQTREMDLAVNWKIYIEAGIEDYHLPYVHSKTLGGYGENYEAEGAPGTYAGFSQRRSIDDVRDRHKGNTSEIPLPVWPAVEKTGTAEIVAMFLQPLGLVFVTPSFLSLTTILPQSPTRTHIRALTWYAGSAAQDSRYDNARQASQTFFRQVAQEDVAFMEEVQGMAKVRDELGLRTRFSPHWERSLHAFQKFYADKITASDA